MVIVRAEYIIGNFLIALAEKGICEVSVPELYKFGEALQHGPFSDGSVLIHYNHQELILTAEQNPFFYVYKRGELHYIRIKDNITTKDLKGRYMGFMPPQVLGEIYKMAREMV